MSNHAQTILHEIPLLDEPTDTPKQKFTVQKTTLFKNNSTFFIIKMKHFSIDHNSSSVDSWQIVLFQKCHDDIMSVSFLKTWKCPKSKTHGEFQLNGFQLWPPLTNPDNFWQKLSGFSSGGESWTSPDYVDLKKLVQKSRKISTKVKTQIDIARREKIIFQKAHVRHSLFVRSTERNTQLGQELNIAAHFVSAR